MQTETSKIFISHAWKDKALVRRLESELKAAGADVWVDHSGIRGGDNLPERISNALKWCNTLLLIWSEAADNSRWVKLEWSSAITLNKRIIPCILDTTELPGILASTLYLDFRDINFGITKLLRELNLARQPSVHVPTSPTEELPRVLHRPLTEKVAKKRLVEVKNKVKKDMENGWGGWTKADKNLWYESGYEDTWQAEMKKECWRIELQKDFTLSNNGIGFHYICGVGLPMSIREQEPARKYFYPWAVLKPFLMLSSPVSTLIK